MLMTILILSFVALIINYLWKWKRLQQSLPPGPKPSLLIGNLKQLDLTDFRKTFVEWRKKYGPVYTVWFGMTPQIFVADADLIKDTFVKHGDSLIDRKADFIFDLISNGSNGILNANGDKWREQRRFSLQVLRNFGLGRPLMEERIMNEVEKFVDTLTHRAKDVNNSFDISHDMNLCVGNIIYRLIVGRINPPGKDSPMYKMKTKLDANLKHMAKLEVNLLRSFPLLRFVPLFGHFGMDAINEAVAEIIGILDHEINLHKLEVDDTSEPNDFTAAYIQEMNRRKKAGESMSYFGDWQLCCVVKDLIIAGMETTVKTLMWAMVLMIKYPAVQAKVQKEIDDVINTDRLPNLTDKARMPYVNAVLHEAQRFGNILPFNFGRNVNEPMTVGGYNIPKDICIVPQISVVHCDEKIFEKPNEFYPERFLESENKNAKKALESLIPFSIGKRMCLGEGLARMELFLIFTSLMQKFEFTTPKGEASPNIAPEPAFTVGPYSFNCSVKLRN